jgi:hypothetical protein
MTLREQVLKAAALPDMVIDNDKSAEDICRGEEQENARLTPLIEALAIVGETAKDYVCPYCMYGDESNYPYCLQYHMCEPIAKLEALLKEGV